MKSSGFFYLIVAVVVTFFSPMHPWAQSPVGAPTSANPEAVVSSEPNDQFYLCRRDKNVRWLRAYKMETGKCRALYSKEGYLQVISSATYFASCEGVLQNVKKNLEEGGFKCSLMSQVSMIDFEGQ